MIWSDKRPFTGRSALFMIIGFFGFIMAVNGVFAFFAMTSWSGLSTDDAYRKGLAYNDRLAAVASQKSKGWSAIAHFDSKEGLKGRLEVNFKDRAGRGIERLGVTGILARPAQLDLDKAVALTGAGDGVYGADVELPLYGVWNMTIIARRDGAPAYRLEQRLWLEPR
jgi:nitrogen fixation protein FixH